MNDKERDTIRQRLLEEREARLCIDCKEAAESDGAPTGVETGE